MSTDLSAPVWLLAGWFVWAILWTYMFAHTRGSWRGRREGYDRCEAGWQKSLDEARERMQAVDFAWARAERRAAVLGRVARGGVVNEGNVIAVLKDGQWQAWDGQPEGEGK